MKFIPYSLPISLVLFVAAAPTKTCAELTIEVTKVVDNAFRVAIVPFDWRGNKPLSEDVTSIVDSDLTLSGRFETLPPEQMLSLPHKSDEVLFRDWRLLDVEYLVIGRMEPLDYGVRLHFELYNVFKQSMELSRTIEGGPNDLRDMAHYVSDQVFEELTGIEGAFSTRIMYVTVTGSIPNRQFQLNIADADGHRVDTVLRSSEPILSASWDPKGERIAYVSFEKDRKPAIYMRNLVDGTLQQLTGYRGLNGAPAFSPDGNELAIVLSKDGNPDIYTLNIETRRLRRITRHYAIDTEPSWGPDGKSIIFTSNRGGQPQIYQIHLEDFQIERLTFEGDYNAKASVVPDGSGLVMVHRRNGTFHIAYLDLRRGRLTVLTETALDESPSIAPNGSMLIYATQVDGQGILAAVSIDGGVKFNLPSTEGDVREPAWSPGKRKIFTPVGR
ncbi:MAG: Tol-Pal system protein TolB [Pseudomonadales bacterium]|nr:Tol-Pal system protein TolB [Pseudomonadales bacterium]